MRLFSLFLSIKSARDTQCLLLNAPCGAVRNCAVFISITFITLLLLGLTIKRYKAVILFPESLQPFLKEHFLSPILLCPVLFSALCGYLQGSKCTNLVKKPCC